MVPSISDASANRKSEKDTNDNLHTYTSFYLTCSTGSIKGVAHVANRQSLMTINTDLAQ